MNERTIDLPMPDLAAQRAAIVKQGLEEFYTTVGEREEARALAQSQAVEIAALRERNAVLSERETRLEHAVSTLTEALAAITTHVRNNRLAFGDVGKEAEKALAAVKAIDDGAAGMAERLRPIAHGAPAPNIAKLSAA